MFSYVSREKAMAEGLAFWTDDGIPGIQVSPFSCALFTFAPYPMVFTLTRFHSHPSWPWLGLTNARRSIGIHSPLVRIEIRSESLLTLYTLVVCF